MQILFILLAAIFTGPQKNSPNQTDMVRMNNHYSLVQNTDQGVEDQKISQLIGYLRGQHNAIFVRNGTEYTPDKAADHLQSKWDKHKKKIKTAHDFVDRLATYSKTKDPYLIKFSDGHTITCGEFLNQELKRMESHAPAAGSSGKAQK